jgi:hypothetical protein
MATITQGNPATLDATFADPDPSGVVFSLQMPDASVVTFTFGEDPEVTNPSPGYYECAIGIPPQVWEYRWTAQSFQGSQLTQTINGTLFVIPSPVQPGQVVPPGPNLGPCFTWITGEDVAACARVDYGSNSAIFDNCAYEASMALYELSGRKYPSLCERSVRPCSNLCSCWLNGPPSYGMGPWYWTTVPWGFAGGWGWYNEVGDKFGCKPMSKVNLGGYPVRKILQVLIDGDELPEFDQTYGFRNWRLDKWMYLVRMDQPRNTPAGPAQPRLWPGCQNMSLDPDQPGTFEITYQWGTDPPQLGRDAAVEIANQLFLACGGRDCVLPVGVTKVSRQGIEIERGLLANWMDTTKGVGLVNTDLFLAAYNNGQRGGRRGAVWSPDLQSKARRVGTGDSVAS